MWDMDTQNSWFIPLQIHQYTIRNYKGKLTTVKGKKIIVPSKLPSEDIILANQGNHPHQSVLQRCLWNYFSKTLKKRFSKQGHIKIIIAC